MLIKFWLGCLLFIGIGIGLILLLGWLWKKMKKRPIVGRTLGFFLGFAFVFIMILGASRLYVVHGDDDYTHYLVYGDGTYTMKDGSIQSFRDNYGYFWVINEAPFNLVAEEVVYGGFSFSSNTTTIFSGEMEQVEGSKIYYFFDVEPPDEINVDSNSDQVIRFWLRKRRD
jgi:hypothetical protein